MVSSFVFCTRGRQLTLFVCNNVGPGLSPQPPSADNSFLLDSRLAEMLLDNLPRDEMIKTMKNCVFFHGHIFITYPSWKGTKSLLFALDLFPEWLIENIFHSNILPSKLSQISSLWNMKIIYQFDACPHSRNRHLPDFNKKKYFLCMQILVRQSRHTNSK